MILAATDAGVAVARRLREPAMAVSTLVEGTSRWEGRSRWADAHVLTLESVPLR